MDSRPLKYCMASLWLHNAYLSNTRGESFPFHMIFTGVDVARPAKPRFVTGEPCVDFFKPRGIPLRELEEERLSVEELEALKLADIEGLYQEDAAERMDVSRPTFQRVLKSARGKVARCLVEGKALGIEAVSYTHLRAHETRHDLVCRLLLEKKKKKNKNDYKTL